MSKTKQRGPLLSSLVMVVLATAATGLLAVVGLQALPESVVQTTFHPGDKQTRHVDVSESPTPRRTVTKPSTAATAVPTPTEVERTHRPRHASSAPEKPAKPATSAPRTTKPVATPTKKPASPSSSPSWSWSRPSPSPSPSPSCRNGRHRKCQSQAPAATSSSTYSTYDTAPPPASDTRRQGQKKAKHQHR